MTQLERLSTETPDFPNLATQHLNISPIFRKTQILPLQELRLLLCLQATRPEPNPSPILPDVYWLKPTDRDHPFQCYQDEHGYFNSTQFLAHLGDCCTNLDELTIAARRCVEGVAIAHPPNSEAGTVSS